VVGGGLELGETPCSCTARRTCGTGSTWASSSRRSAGLTARARPEASPEARTANAHSELGICQDGIDPLGARVR
jgi:hypothetical protein